MQCFKVFNKPYHESLKNWNNRHKYCSRECFDTFRRFDTKLCKNCLIVPVKRAGKIYCSVQCRAVFYSGVRNNKWNGGITPINEKIRKSPEYKIWRISVFQRDDYTCVFCFNRGGEIQADHIKPFAFYPELRFEPTNGRTLCKPCHRKTPTYGRSQNIAN